jgi:hypothetical protein
MKLRSLAAGGLSIAFGLCLALFAIGSSAAQVKATDPLSPAKMPEIGRYQISASGPIIFMLDTTTGEAWQASSGNNRWQQLVKPLAKPKP